MNSVETTLAFVYIIMIACFIIGINSAVITFAAIALNITD